MQKWQQIICDKCYFNFEYFYNDWKINNHNNELFIFCIEKKYQGPSNKIDLNELIPDYAFACNSTWFVIYSIKKIQTVKTLENFDFDKGILLIGLYWYQIFINDIIQSRWYNLPRG